jgi:hypothetical protein
MKDIIKLDLIQNGREWTQWRAFVITVMNTDVLENAGNFLTSYRNTPISFSPMSASWCSLSYYVGHGKVKIRTEKLKAFL